MAISICTNVLYCPGPSTNGCSQLKHQNLRVGGYTEKVLKRINYLHARAHTGCKVRCHGTESTCIVHLSVLRRGRTDSGEKCIVLQSGPTRSLVAKFLQCSAIAGSTQISRCRGRTLQTRPWTGVCKALMPDVMVPQVHQNNRSYVSSADLPSGSLCKNLAWSAVT